MVPRVARSECAPGTQRLRGAICCATGASRSISSEESKGERGYKGPLQPGAFPVLEIHVTWDLS